MTAPELTARQRAGELTPRQRAEQLSSPLPPLLLAAERVAATVAQGVHGRRRVGQGETFWQYREYEAGDAASSIDWRRSARGERLFVRQTEWEAAQSVWLWRDASPSMDWRSQRDLPTKRERAELLTLALMVLMMRAGEHVTLLGSGLPPAAGHGTLGRMAAVLEREGTPDTGGLPKVERLPRAAQVLLIGDFLTPLDAVSKTLKSLSEMGVSGHLVQIRDPAEETLPYEGRVRFEGLEGEAPWLLSRVEDVRAQYRRRLEAHSEAIADMARRIGWRCTWHRSDRPPQAALLAIYSALAGMVAK